MNKKYLQMEIWASIRELNNEYEISYFGRLRKTISKEIIAPIIQRGYYKIFRKVNGSRRSLRIHRLVGYYFIPNPQNKPFINHKDGNKLNNHGDNLEWSTARENTYHYYRNRKKATKKFTLDDIEKMYQLNKLHTLHDVAKIFKTDFSVVQKLLQYVHPLY